VEVLLDSGATGLVMSLEFARKQGFKLKKIERPIYMRNVNRTFNKKVLYPKLQNMSETCFNTTSNSHGYLALFVSKTLSVVWYFIMDLILSKLYSYFTLFELKSVVIFICVCCLIIFKLCKFTWTLYIVFSSSNLNSYIVFY